MERGPPARTKVVGAAPCVGPCLHRAKNETPPRVRFVSETIEFAFFSVVVVVVIRREIKTINPIHESN